MDDSKDIWESVRYWLTERFASPFLGPYIFSWLIWNYRVVLILLGSGELPLKLSLLSNQLEPMWGDPPIYILGGRYLYVFLGPLCTTIFYIAIYPTLFALPAYKLRLAADRAFKAARIEGDKLALMPVDEGNRLRVEIDRLGERHSADRAKDLQLITALRARNESLELEVSKLRSPETEKPKSANSHNESVESLLEFIYMAVVTQVLNTESRVPSDLVNMRMVTLLEGVSRTRVRSTLDSLLAKNLLTRDLNGYLNLNPVGRKFVVSNKLDGPDVIETLQVRYKELMSK